MQASLRISAPFALLASLAGAFFLPATSFAQSPPPLESPWEGTSVAEVRFRGQRSIDAAELEALVNTRPGETLSLQTVSEDIKRLYATGRFDDIVVDASWLSIDNPDTVITFYLTERPSVVGVRWSGFEDDDIEALEPLVSMGVAQPLKPQVVDEDLAAIESFFHDKGYSFARARFETEPVDERGDLVELVYVLEQGPESQVVQIEFLGNQALDDALLEAVLTHQKRNPLSVITDAGKLEADRLELDRQRLLAIYTEYGHLEATVGEARAAWSPDGRNVHITFEIEEGPVYRVSRVAVEGAIWPASELALREGETFALSRVLQDQELLLSHFRELGDARVQVAVVDERDAASHTVAVRYEVKEGPTFRFGKVTFAGHVSSADELMRRLCGIPEGAIYQASMVRRCERDMRRSGLFLSVTAQESLNTEERLAHILVEVEEADTVRWKAGGGVGVRRNVSGSLEIGLTNALGWGKRISVAGTLSTLSRSARLRYDDPALFGSDWMFSAGLTYAGSELLDYGSQRTGFSLGLAYRLTQNLAVELGASLEDFDLSGEGRLICDRCNFGALVADDLSSRVVASLRWESRDNPARPRDGGVVRVRGEVADRWTGSEAEYAKVALEGVWYLSLVVDVVLSFRFQGAYLASTRGQALPLFERLLVGGPSSLRGFEVGSLGPVVELASDGGDPLSELTSLRVGGDLSLYGGIELSFPLFQPLGLRMAGFLDVGQAFDTQAMDWGLDWWEESDHVLRTSAGVGLRLETGRGPIHVDWGFPLAPRPGERASVFSLSLGGVF